MLRFGYYDTVNTAQQNQNKTKKMISMAQVEQMFFLFQKINQKINARPTISEKLNDQNYTKWYKEMKIEIGDRGRLNHIIIVPPTTTTEQ